ncbi:hypothetical protein [Nocardioides marmorisolisilvae]|uniref:DUF3352 domain-containing protein n=1 Tax=Nocardioides marmorisolisilvae TaxID=1542737 RepID=A0A3N0DS66_9ACTN|nr:hypothetical protein [Nocardioides marmorisolisilvae]RNL78469.1 hypothetical protein EFL95_05075 [Nocardioides marmorisolisilvae]
MSMQDPGTSAQTDEDFAVPVPRAPGKGRRYVASFAAAALSLGAVGAGVWAWRSFMDQGAQPAEALPANTLAYAALDLDPPGGQKVEAFKTLQKFPSIKKELGLDSVDDVQKSVVDEITSDSHCGMSYSTMKPWLGDRMAVALVQEKNPEGVVVLQLADADKAKASLAAKTNACHFGFAINGDWAILARSTTVAEEVKSAASPGSTLSDHADYKRLTKAAGDPGLVTLYAAPEAGQALLDAVDKDPYSAIGVIAMVNAGLDPVTSFITTFGLLYAVVPEGPFSSSSDDYGSSDYAPHMTPAQKKEQARLDEQFAHYDELTPAQRKALDKEQQKFFEELFGPNGENIPGMNDGDSSSSSSSGGVRFSGSGPIEVGPGNSAPIRTGARSDDEFPTPTINPALREALKNFKGLGGVGRITDGTVEVEIVGDPLKGTAASMYDGDKADSLVSDLPSDVAAVFGAGLAQGWVDLLFDQIDNQFMFGGSSQGTAAKSFEKATGLTVPTDLEALGGDGVSIIAGSGVNLDDIAVKPEDEPVAARVTGNPDKVEAALDKLRKHLGSGGDKILSHRVGSDVFISASADFLKQLEKSGDLAGTDTFKKVVPDADHAASILFINFNAGDWLAKEAGRDKADVAPLRAFGQSVTKSDGVQHIRIRLSFD